MSERIAIVLDMSNGSSPFVYPIHDALVLQAMTLLNQVDSIGAKEGYVKETLVPLHLYLRITPGCRTYCVMYPQY